MPKATPTKINRSTKTKAVASTVSAHQATSATPQTNPTSSATTTERPGPVSVTPQNPYLAQLRERKRTEDSRQWPFHIPRELMDIILGDPGLGVREHMALAATCTALRRLYHNGDVFPALLKHRTIPYNGVPRLLERPYGPEPRQLRVLATSPQKPKANGPYFKPLAEPYSSHNFALTATRKHRISLERVKELYPNLTEEHLARLRYYPEYKSGYPNQWTNEGYAETAVEWLSIRVRNGWE